MARAEMVVEVKLSKEFKNFIDLFCDTLDTLTALNDLVAKDSCINTTQEYQNIVKMIELIVERGKQVDHGKS